MASGSLDTPVGRLTVLSAGDRITGLRWGGHAGEEGAGVITEALAQLQAYFGGRLQSFDLPLDVQASEFQRAACAAMSAIPFGETRSYGELARDLDVTAQAIGGACGGNPIPVIIPCHRVLGANGLGGYSGAGGIETKVWLLKHEKAGGLLI